MAKSPTSKSGTAKVRFIMLDAEISDGDFNQIAQVIQNAFKPTTTIVHQRAPDGEPKSLAGPSIEIDGEIADDGDTLGESDSVADGSNSKAPRAPRARRPTTPDVIEIDLTSDVSWSDFADSHDVKSDVDRYLTVATWLKEHRSVDAISADHVYTCFRAVGWSTAIEDFSQHP